MATDGKWIECDISAAFGTNGRVADLHGPRVGDAVESQFQRVLGVCQIFACTARRVVVERINRSQGFHLAEVVWRAGRDGLHAKPANGV
jgi:hypothetical protein